MIGEEFKIVLNQDNAPSVSGWSKKDCTQDRVQECVLQKFQSIVEDGQRRLEGYKTDVKLLNSGFWYPTDYYKALLEKNEKGRLDWGKKGPFFYGHPPKNFDTMRDISKPGGKKISGYILKKETLPSEALKSVRESLCFFDCQEAIQLAQYEALLEILGEKRFNEQFSLNKSALVLSNNPEETPLFLFQTCQKFKSLDPTFLTSMKKGDQVFFTNLPSYRVKHVNGEGAGFHALCSQKGDEKKFIAFGVPKEGVTEEGMLKVLVEEFNKQPIPSKTLYSEEFIIKIKEKMPTHLSNEENGYKQGLNKRQVTIEELNQIQKTHPKAVGLKPFIRRLDAQKIVKLMNN